MPFKMYIIYDRNTNDVAVHLDRDMAKDLMFYLIHSVSKKYEKEKFINCTNPIAGEAERGNKHSKRIMRVREKLLELLIEKIS